MSIDKLTRIAELKEERDDHLERAAALDREIAKLLGEGFEIPGVARVKPIKKYGPKRKLDDGAPELQDAHNDTTIIMPAPSKLTTPPPVAPKADDKPSADRINAEILRVMRTDLRRAWTAPDVHRILANEPGKAEWKLQWVASGLYWLGNKGLASKAGAGMYRAKAAA